MLRDSFDFQRFNSSAYFDDPVLGPNNIFSLLLPSAFTAISDNQKFLKGSQNPGGHPTYDPTVDYVVGKGDARHTVMVEQFLRLLWKEHPTKAADAVVLVDIPGRVYGYGYRKGSSLADPLALVHEGSIMDVLAENMKRHWLNRNIECIALQQQHWRIFRWYSLKTTYTLLMDFHPLEIQRTALVLWVLEEHPSPLPSDSHS